MEKDFFGAHCPDWSSDTPRSKFPPKVSRCRHSGGDAFEHSRSWIAGAISCKRFELSAVVERLERLNRFL
jgi:hypothetical protein